MFTGIITDIGEVVAVKPISTGYRVEIATRYDVDAIDLGASIAHAGVCLTVVDRRPGVYSVDVSPETLAVTTLKDWTPGASVNLEQAARLGDALGGHIVSGHVDGVARVTLIAEEGDYRRLRFQAPAPLHRFIATKGSVTVDGVSLTVNRVEEQDFDVCLIPHTLAVTTLSALVEGHLVNLEIDMLARYAARWRETQ